MCYRFRKNHETNDISNENITILDFLKSINKIKCVESYYIHGFMRFFDMYKE